MSSVAAPLQWLLKKKAEDLDSTLKGATIFNELKQFVGCNFRNIRVAPIAGVNISRLDLI